MRRGLISSVQGLFRKKRSLPPAATPPAVATSDARHIEYSPHLDGEPDPGEVVWTWVPYEEDATQGKDRPVVVIGRQGDQLLAVALTSKPHPHEVSIGAGRWDPERRPSYAKIERLLLIDPTQVRREGAVLERSRFDDIVAGVQRYHQVL